MARRRGEDREYAWERLPGETAVQWRAFLSYRDMPASSRSIRAAWLALLKAEGRQPPRYQGTAPSSWRKWSADNQWVARTAEHDGDLDRRARLAMAEDLVRGRQRIKDLGMAGLVKLAQRLHMAQPDEIEMRTWSNMFARCSEMLLRATGGYLPHEGQVEDDEDLD